MITCFGTGSGPNGGAVFRDLTARWLGIGLVRGAVPKFFSGSGLRVPVLPRITLSPVRVTGPRASPDGPSGNPEMGVPKDSEKRLR
ncbi:hypothetical protein QFZ79_000811 [Arthrobacter sp. V4I6]|nr:hypothetical protein [Arthrobacter sp. V1I7]MDQ0852700.1 hypothetical protein [Arthrobacter sp. V4I6]